jgi:hypothetical protein
MRNPNHVVADSRFLGGSLRTQANNHERGANLAAFAGSELVHRGSRGGYLGMGVAHDSLPCLTEVLSNLLVSSAPDWL